MIRSPGHHPESLGESAQGGRLTGLRDASLPSPARAVMRAERARRLGVLVGLFAAALVVFGVSPALADDQQVQAEDNAFIRPAVAVKPGESVTWTYPFQTETHNVHFEDNLFTNPSAPSRGPWTGTRTFASEGVYLYHCQNHGGPGGQGMSGVVYVNATGTVPGTPPTASFTASPGTARVGQNVSFNATGTSDPDGTIIRHEWDLDGNGSYETDTAARPGTALSYATAGTRTIKLRVTDSQRHTNETTRSLSVTNEPTASFTVSPSPAQTGRMVSFNGAASSDPDGTIAKYEWDLDGNGAFETATGATPTTSRSYSSSATLSIRLRVTDNLGVTSETTRSLQINAATQKSKPKTSPPRKSCRRLKGAKRAACVRKGCRYLKRSKRTSCRRKSCRFLKGTKKRACVRKYRRKS